MVGITGYLRAISLNHASIIFKLTASFLFFFILVLSAVGVSNYVVAQSNLKKAEEEKVKTILSTVIPILPVYLSFGMDESLAEHMDNMIRQNRHILGMQIKDKDGMLLFSHYQEGYETKKVFENSKNAFIASEAIINPLTSDNDGTVFLAYSDSNYKSAFNRFLYSIFAVVMFFLVSFALLFSYFIKTMMPLHDLTHKLEIFDPADLGSVHLKRLDKNDEISIINDTAYQMLEKIREYTTELADINKNLERRIEKEVEENRTKDQIMIQQSRQAELGEMIGNIAHQWRQPLNAVGLLIQDTLDAYENKELDESYLRRNVKDAMRLIEHMSTTIDDFRNFFNPQKEKRYFFLKEAMEQVMGIVGAALENNEIKVQMLQDSECPIYGYDNEFSQVLINMINNSKDAYKQLNSGEIKKEINLESYADRASGEIVVTIYDHAGGVREEVLDKIFNPYFTTKPQGEGTGIGLYMSKSIIEKNMGGRISVKNKNGGLEFTIVLPMSECKESSV